MLSALDDFIRRHRDSGVLVDTNMLLVYLVGLLDRTLVPKVGTKRGYSEADSEALELVFGEFNRLLVTPAILAEVSNLSMSRLNSDERGRFFKFLRQLLPTEAFLERSATLKDVAGNRSFEIFGFTDATIEEIGRGGVGIFTDDALLYEHLGRQNLEVFNYNHVRMILTES